MVVQSSNVVVDVSAFAEKVLDAVDVVIEDENDRLDAVASHDADFIEGELVGAIAGDHPSAAGLFGEADAQRGRGGPSDGAPESLALGADSFGKNHGIEVHHASARLNHQSVTGFQATLEAGVEVRRGEFVVAVAGGGEEVDFFGDDRLGAGLHLREKTREDIVNGGVHENLSADLHMAVPDGNHAVRVEVVGEKTCIQLGEDDSADVQHQVGAFDDLLDGGGRREIAVVEADELRNRLVEGTLFRRGDGGRKVDFAEEFMHLRAEAVTGGEGGHDGDGILCRLQAQQDRGERAFQFRGNARLAFDFGEGFSCDRSAHDRGITREFGDRDVGGLAQAQGLADDALQFLDAVGRGEDSCHSRRGTRDR